MKKVLCIKCLKEIDLNKDLYVSLGTHDGKTITEMKYYHFQCWRLYFEECARQKAEIVVNSMQKRMMPIAKQLTEKLKVALGQN